MGSEVLPFQMLRYGDLRTISRFLEGFYHMRMIERTLNYVRFDNLGEAYTLKQIKTDELLVHTIIPPGESVHFHQIMDLLKIYFFYDIDPTRGVLQKRENVHEYYPRLVHGELMVVEQDEFLGIVDSGFEFALGRGLCNRPRYSSTKK